MSEEKAWASLNERGIYTHEEAYKLFEETEDVDFGFLATPLDLDEVRRLRKIYFGG